MMPPGNRFGLVGAQHGGTDTIEIAPVSRWRLRARGAHRCHCCQPATYCARAVVEAVEQAGARVMPRG